MNKVWATKKGFTIVELLVVMVVIGILVSITIVSYSSVQQRARDSTRDGDITLLKIAVEKYHADNSQYPKACAVDNSACYVNSLDTLLAPYLKSVPHDPRYAANTADDYVYVRGSSTSVDSYAFKVKYEAKAECKTGHNLATGWWGSAIPTC